MIEAGDTQCGSMRINGKVKWYNSVKGYGFIKVDGKDKDVFFHAKNWNLVGRGMLPVEGEPLNFTLNQGDKGEFASDIQRG